MRQLALLVSLFLAACTALPERDASPSERRLVSLVEERLELGKEVAWAKFHSGKPIYDPKRESELLDSLVAAGAPLGLSSFEVRIFFSAQMLASRRLQEELLANWKAGRDRPTHPPLDLATEIRPRLDRVSTAMLAELPRVRHWSPEAISYAANRLEKAKYSPPVVTAAIGCLPK